VFALADERLPRLPSAGADRIRAYDLTIVSRKCLSRKDERPSRCQNRQTADSEFL